MFTGKLVFAQLMGFLPLHTFRRCVARYPSSYSRPVDKTTGLRCDQTVRLTGVKSPDDYIFTELEFEPLVEKRFAAIKQGFDRIRGRTPKR